MMKPLREFLSQALFLAVGFVYGISFTLPVLKLDNWDGNATGAQAFAIILLVGEMSPTSARAGDWGELLLLVAGWLPNPAVWCGLIFVLAGRWGAAAVAGMLGLLLAALWLFDDDRQLLLSGYYVWFASTVLLAVVGLAGLLWNARSPCETPSISSE